MREDHQELKRVRSLKKETGDQNQFRHHRNRLIGHTVSTEFHQTIPFFFTREMCQLNLIGNYRGASAFMICNGPSLANGRYDLSLLKRPGVITYGMNNGARTVRPNFWTCVDDPKRFLKSIWLDPTITKIVPHAHSEKSIFDNEAWKDLAVEENGKKKQVLVGQCPNVIYFHRNSKFMADRFLWEDTINWGNHKDYNGGRSVMLPVLRILFLLGFRKVYMLGADFRMSQDYTYHFDEQRSKGAVNGNLSTYDKLKSEMFPALKPHFDQAGFEVWNCTEGSQLDVFPFIKYEDAIEEATSKIGDVNSRTWGLYGKPEERKKHIQEPDPIQKVHLRNISEDVLNAPKYTQTTNRIKYVQPKEEHTTDALKLNVKDIKKRESKTDIVSRNYTKLPKIEKLSDILNESERFTIEDDCLKEATENKGLNKINTENTENTENTDGINQNRIVKKVPMISSRSSDNCGGSVRKVTQKINLSHIDENITIEDNGL